MMLKIIKIINVFLFIILILCLGFILGKKYDITIDENNKFIWLKHNYNEEKIQKILNLIENKYVENVNSDSLLDNTISQLLIQLDPHSTYLNVKEAKNNANSMENSYKGIGIQFQNINDTIVITNVISNSPAKNKLSVGDKILQINKNSILAFSENKLIDYLEKNNTPKIFSVLRNNKIIQHTLISKNIPLPAIVSSYMINNKLGFIKLTKFSQESSSELKKAIQVLTLQGMKQLILDLRDNPGGLLDEAEKIADEFIPDKKLIVYTKDKNGKQENIYAKPNGAFETGNLYVLINENSASGSEVVSGALQDNDLATIVGRRSFGKGLVQREVNLDDGSKIRLSTATYYTPTGRSIQKPYKNNKEYFSDDMIARLKSGELYDKNKIKSIDSLKKITPKGKIVYGGGGIVPDVFVGEQHLNLSEQFYQNKGYQITQHFIIDYIKNNNEELNLLSKNNFINTHSYYQLLLQYKKFLHNYNITLTNKQTQTITPFLKANLGRLLYDEDTFYKLWNPYDSMIIKVLELTKKQS